MTPKTYLETLPFGNDGNQNEEALAPSQSWPASAGLWRAGTLQR